MSNVNTSTNLDTLNPQTLFFNSHGKQCEASLFVPANKPLATIILAQGFGALWQFGTSNAIHAYVQAGYAVFAFNYRGFGESEGLPRQFINPFQQVEDWCAAIEHIKANTKLADKIILWGSSFSGGHVISSAAKVSGISAVLAQVPHCDSRSAFEHVGLKKSLSGLMHALIGSVTYLFRHEHCIAIVAEPNSGAAGLSYLGWKQAYLGMADTNLRWENKVPARCLLSGNGYNPIDTAEQISCPVFIAYGANDQGILMSDVEATAAKIDNCELWKFDGDHFDAYDGGCVNAEVIQRQLDFLAQQLK